jgi:DNA-binding phage protein
MPRIKRLYRKMTARELKEHKGIRAEIEREKPELQALGRQLIARQNCLRKALAALKAAREAKGLSLEEIGEKSGIGKANLSRLENSRNPNPKIDTLARYAEAIGLDLVITVRAAARK